MNNNNFIQFSNKQNFPPTSVQNTLKEDQQPLGTQFKSYELNGAINYYLLDPFQYSITKFDYRLPNGEQTNQNNGTSNGTSINSVDFKNDPGLIYRDVNFDTLGKFDMIFTCPPYYNLEVYTEDKNQSCNRYPEYKFWLDKV